MSEVSLSEKFSKFLSEKKCIKISENEQELFNLKSGRKSPFFINMGALTDGSSLNYLADAFAEKIVQLVSKSIMQDFDYIYGPAYKGIPLAAITAVSLSKNYGKEAKILYDRKEAKTHGDVKADKLIVGADQFIKSGRILIIDDVITNGASKLEAVDKLNILGDFKLVGIIVAVDRQEASGDVNNLGPGAAQLMKEKLGINLYSIANSGEIYSALNSQLTELQKHMFKDYFEKFGTDEVKKWVKSK